MTGAAAQRIVSFLPSATEMVYALGAEDRLMGVSHECDFPLAAREKIVVVGSVVPPSGLDDREIDSLVSERLQNGLSLYEIDEAKIRAIAPDLILTQDLCQVCAPSGDDVSNLLRTLSPVPDVLRLTPRTLSGIFDSVLAVGMAAGASVRAEALVADARARLEKIATKTREMQRPRVFCLEWIAPVYCSGHWLPEMIRIAGGEDALAREGADSRRIDWEDVRRWRPDIIIVMPCGFDAQEARSRAEKLRASPGWNKLPAVRSGRVYAVDASSYFARPGPRVVDGTELLAHLIHPDAFAWNGPRDAYSPLTP